MHDAVRTCMVISRIGRVGLVTRLNLCRLRVAACEPFIVLTPIQEHHLPDPVQYCPGDTVTAL